jgi:hypothetical protein
MFIPYVWLGWWASFWAASASVPRTCQSCEARRDEIPAYRSRRGPYLRLVVDNGRRLTG